MPETFFGQGWFVAELAGEFALLLVTVHQTLFNPLPNPPRKGEGAGRNGIRPAANGGRPRSGSGYPCGERGYKYGDSSRTTPSRSLIGKGRPSTSAKVTCRACAIFAS